MSEEQLKAFLEAVKADAGLQEKLKAAADADAVVAIAKEAGFMISADELQRAGAVGELVGEELSDEELEGVAGGMSGNRCVSLGCPINVPPPLMGRTGRVGKVCNLSHQKPLPPQGLFISSIFPKAPKTTPNTWHYHPPTHTNLNRFSRPN